MAREYNNIYEFDFDLKKNVGLFNLEKAPYGKSCWVITIDGEKLYCDIRRTGIDAHVTIYNYVSADRNSFSALDKEADASTIHLEKKKFLTSEMVRNRKDIEFAQNVIKKYDIR